MSPFLVVSGATKERSKKNESGGKSRDISREKKVLREKGKNWRENVHLVCFSFSFLWYEMRGRERDTK